MIPESPGFERESDGQRQADVAAGSAPMRSTALVFGREESGLTEAELRLCTLSCSIPTGRIQASMNLSHAVAVILAQLFEKRALLDEPEAGAPTVIQAEDGSSGPSINSEGLVATSFGSSIAADHQPGEGGPTSSGNGVFGGSVARQQVMGQAAAANVVQKGSYDRPDAALLPAAASEVESLLAKFAAIASAAGTSSEETRGGGGNHGRKKLPLGNLRAILNRSRIMTGEVRSLHGLASVILTQLEGGAAKRQE